MYLVIDNSLSAELVLHMYQKQIWIIKIFERENKKPILTYIDEFLRTPPTTIADLQGVGVIFKKGSFTSTRIAVTLANILAYTYRIPVVGMDEFNEEIFLKQMKKKSMYPYLSAEYSGIPHVT